MAKKNRAILATLALAAALALPSGAFAADTVTGSTAESLVLPATVTFTAPTTATYSGPKSQMSATLPITLATDNGKGLTVTVGVNADAAGLITRASRSMNATASAGITVPSADLSFSTSPKTILSSTGPVTGGTASVTSRVDATGYAAGTFQGTLSWTAQANP